MPSKARARRAQVVVPTDELLIDGEERNPGLSWPLAVDQWLENKLQQARAAGMTTSRKELAAALLTYRNPDDATLVKILRSYRTKTAGDLLQVRDSEGAITFLRQGPGPRARRRPTQ